MGQATETIMGKKKQKKNKNDSGLQRCARGTFLTVVTPLKYFYFKYVYVFSN